MLVDDDDAFRRYGSTLISSHGFNVALASSGFDALRQLNEGLKPHLMIVDIIMPGMDGMETLRKVKADYPAMPVIMLSGQNSVPLVVETLKAGACDYLTKPLNDKELEKSINYALANSPREERNRLVSVIPLPEEDEFLFVSEPMLAIRKMADQIARVDVPVLIRGETGSGKEVLARYIVTNSPRRGRPLIKVNCAALPSGLLESELFGYEAGAFTGALKSRPGRFEQAHGGSILLDEVGEISPGLQAKLLQVLQDGTFSPLGSNKEVKTDVRVFALTNRNLETALKDGSFREDLYFRLNVISILLPPLRERKDDILLLGEYFLKKFQQQYNKRGASLSPRARECFQAFPWPGNIRELTNIVKKLVILGDEELILRELQLKGGDSGSFNLPPADVALPVHLKKISKRAALQAEGEVIIKALENTNWNRLKTAKLLGVSYKTLLSKMKQCGIKKG